MDICETVFLVTLSVILLSPRTYKMAIFAAVNDFKIIAHYNLPSTKGYTAISYNTLPITNNSVFSPRRRDVAVGFLVMFKE